MLAVTEPGVHVITAMVSTQLLKTSLLENVFGYFAHLDPCPMLLVQPKEDAAEQFSRERITPLIRATPVLTDLVGTSKTRSKDETLLFKSFPGGFLALTGAGSPDNLARRPVRVVLYDECDKYPTTREGDPIALGDERMATFVNWLSIRACSPTVEGESKIEESFLEGDQRLSSVVCPHCQHRQFLEFFKHVEWDKGADGKHHRPETARVYCEKCGVGWSEGERLRALATLRAHQTRTFECCGERQSPLDTYEAAWKGDLADPVAAAWDLWEGWSPGPHPTLLWQVYRAHCGVCGSWPVPNEHASFQGGKIYSPWPKDTPAKIAAKWRACGDDEDKKQVFNNTQLGRPYRRSGGRELNVEELLNRRISWPGQVPIEAAVLTAGIDTQDYRIEIETVAWGRDEESWSVDYRVIDGEFDDPMVQQQLDEYLLQDWTDALGRKFRISAACHDSGGHKTQAVYAFSRARLARRVWAIRGASEQSGQRQPVWPKAVSRKKSATFRPVVIGVNAAKDVIRGRLALTGAGPGRMHFGDDVDIGRFQQLTAERSELKVKGGKRFRVWEKIKGRANEALDCRVYAYAALQGWIHNGLKLNQLVDRMAAIAELPTPIVAGEPSPDAPATPQTTRGAYSGGYVEAPENWL